MGNNANAPADPGRKYSIGSLIYSPRSLMALFGWLLWGDFVLTFMEMVLPSLLPLILKSHQASNGEITVITGTLFMALNAILNPIISFRSDHFRSRWGRRRPFIIVTTPFVVILLAAIPFAPDITHNLMEMEIISTLLKTGPAAPVIIVFGVLVALFQVFNMFVGSVYYYLIPDVVPKEVLGRFYALFRVFGALAGIGFNYFIFGLAENHMKLIFVVTAVLYGFFILLMCWQVKEGEYPTPIKSEQGKWWMGVQRYLGECFGNSYYWWVFATYSALGWSGIGNLFSVFFFRDNLGMSLDLIGKVAAWSGVIFIVFAYPWGVVIDRWGAHRALISSFLMLAVSSLLGFFLSVDQMSGCLWFLIRSLSMSLGMTALTKWIAEVYPSERYGQFGSAGALFSSVGGILLGPLCGWLMDLLGDYRIFLIWSSVLASLGFCSAIVVYHRWTALGGRYCYRAP